MCKVRMTPNKQLDATWDNWDRLWLNLNNSDICYIDLVNSFDKLCHVLTVCDNFVAILWQLCDNFVINLWQLCNTFVMNFWTPLMSCVDFWRFITTFEDFVITPDDLRHFVMTCEHLWRLMPPCDNLWWLVTACDNLLEQIIRRTYNLERSLGVWHSDRQTDWLTDNASPRKACTSKERRAY